MVRRAPAVRAGGESGFTLTELLLALVVTMSVLGAATLLAGRMQSSYRAQLEGAAAQQEGRHALEWIERYLRAAGNNPYRVQTTDCPAPGTPFLAFRLDPDGNGVHNDIRLQMDASPVDGLIGGPEGVCTEPNEDLTIAYDAVTRAITVTDHNIFGQPQARTDAVIDGLEFIYRDPNRDITTTAEAVAFVETIVTVRSRMNDLETGAPLTFSLRSEVRVRSR
jgi:type II secretory pathway pseudopilin PulG